MKIDAERIDKLTKVLAEYLQPSMCDRQCVGCKCGYCHLKGFAEYLLERGYVEKGTLVELPCKAGDTVYYILNKSVMSGTVMQIHISEYGYSLYTLKHRYKARAYIYLYQDDFGEKWFTDELAAEKKIKEQRR